MALKNFFFYGKLGLEGGGWYRNNLVLPFSTQPGPTLWPQIGPNKEFLKQNFNFQSLRKTEAILLPSM